jgi:glycine oxidase
VNILSVDNLVVGQGLAGSCLAVQIMEAGESLMVIDKPGYSRCSHVAAGLFNPLTGQNMVKSWMTDQLFPYLHDFYRNAEKSMGERFYHPMPVYRPFINQAEQNDWMARSTDENFASMIRHVHGSSVITGINDRYGGVMLKMSGFIQVGSFLDTVRRHLIDQGALTEELFDYNKLELKSGYVVYENIRAQRVIFCEGYRLDLNPWFKNLPLRPLKGETIDIKSEMLEDVILNRGVYMVPGARVGTWKVGSTYNGRDTSLTTTEAGRLELEKKLKDLMTAPFEIISQDWGIRPTTPDRRPVLGRHPEFEQLFIFNGLGTKGVTLAPYFSKALFHHIKNPANSLNKEVDVTRFKSLY